MIEQIINYFMYGLIAIAAIIGVFFVLFVAQFKIQVQIRRVIDGRAILYHDKAKRYTDKEGVEWLQLLKMKKPNKLMPLPPEAAIDMTSKGKEFITAYLDAKNNYTFVVDDPSKQAFIGKQEDYKALFSAQIRRAESERKKSIHDWIGTITNAGALVLIIALFLIFIGDAIEPAQVAGERFESASSNFEQAAIVLSERCLSLDDIQTLGNENRQQGGSAVAPQ